MKSILTSAVLCASSAFANAGTAPVEPLVISTPESSPWEFRITPYAWLTAIDGSSGPDGFVSDLDAGFDDIFDVLEMAAALQVEARIGRWGFMADGFYAELGSSGTLPGPLQTHVDVDFKQFLGEATVFYRVSETPRSFIDLYAGARYNSIDLEITATSSGTLLPINASRSGDESWIDPMVGIRTQWDLNDRWFLAAKGDIGGFGAASEFTWNLQGSVGYKFTESASLEVGYRYFDTDYSGGGFTYDIAQSGLLLGLNFRF